MTADQARRSAKRLVELRLLLERSMATASKKRAGPARASERAMSLASYAMDIEAVQNAIDLMVKTYHIKLGDLS